MEGFLYLSVFLLTMLVGFSTLTEREESGEYYTHLRRVYDKFSGREIVIGDSRSYYLFPFYKPKSIVKVEYERDSYDSTCYYIALVPEFFGTKERIIIAEKWEGRAVIGFTKNYERNACFFHKLSLYRFLGKRRTVERELIKELSLIRDMTSI